MLTTTQTAKILKVTEARIRQMCIAKSLKGKKFGHIWMISEKEVSQYERKKYGKK